MKTKLIFVAIFAMAITSSAFAPAIAFESESFTCTSPNNPRNPFINTDGQNYIDARTGALGGADGYEWEVIGGFIISGQGTNQISIGPDCTSTSNITVRVRAFNNGTGGAKCYSGWAQTTFYWTGPCFSLY